MRRPLQANWQVCISPVHTGEKLPLGYYFGVTAATSELVGQFSTSEKNWCGHLSADIIRQFSTVYLYNYVRMI